MSVTFSIAPSVLVEEKWVRECGCGSKQSATQYSSWQEAQAAAEREPKVLCGDEYCAEDWGNRVALAPQEGDELSINLSNVNAAFVLDALGYPRDVYDDLSGSASGEDLAGRISMALALSPEDEGVPAHEAVGSGARVINCGRAPGYLQDRLSDLWALAQFSIKTGRVVTWA